MRQIGTIPGKQQAFAFADYLLTLNITTRLDQEPNGWAVWICDEDRVSVARQEFQEFQKNPDDPRYYHAAQTASQLRKQEEQKEKQYRKNFIEMRDRWADMTTGKRLFTITLTVICVLTIIGTDLTDYGRQLANLLRISPLVWTGTDWSNPGLEPILHGEVWRLVTPIIMHVGLLHLIFNMMWLNFLGPQIETRKGSWFLALLVLATAIPSNLAQFYVSGPNFAGMSGVIFGLFGYIWMKERFQPEEGLYVGTNNVLLMIVWFFICMTGWVGPIANTAHGVGLALGMAFGMTPTFWKNLKG